MSDPFNFNSTQNFVSGNGGAYGATNTEMRQGN